MAVSIREHIFSKISAQCQYIKPSCTIPPPFPLFYAAQISLKITFVQHIKLLNPVFFFWVVKILLKIQKSEEICVYKETKVKDLFWMDLIFSSTGSTALKTEMILLRTAP